MCDVSFHIIDGRMTVDLDPDAGAPTDVQAAVERLGMRAEPWSDPDESPESWWSRHSRHVAVAVSGSALVGGLVTHGLAGGRLAETLLAHDHGGHSVSAPVLALFGLAIICGLAFSLRKAVFSLYRLRPDMNALVLVSTVGAMFLEQWAEAGTLAFLYGLSGLIETWSAARARSAIGSLIRLSPATASLIHGDHEHRVPVERLRVGSHVRVRPGERIPCDGTVTVGSSFVDQALVTGESIPVWKSVGDLVFAGTLNGHGVVEVETTRATSDTTLARIIRMVGESHRHRAPTERFVDQFARYYTPLMFVVAASVALLPPIALGGGWSEWFYQGMLILLISCPCALAISTPVTIAAALTSAARQGVLIKGGAHLEGMGGLRAVAFDKTGVITRGEPAVVDLTPVGGRSEAEVLSRLRALEMRSEHPLSRAIVAYARDRGVQAAELTDFEALEGRGAAATVEGREFWVGSLGFASEKTGGELLVGELATLPSAERTVVVCGVGDEVWAVVSLSDQVRPEAEATIGRLASLGVQSTMLTGDNQVTARGVGDRVGVTDVRAELLPDGKAEAIRSLLADHGTTAMVGDGINDSQALLEASVGVALGGSATDIAMESADVVMMRDDLAALPFLIEHARRARAVIIQNITLALGAKALFLAVMAVGAATLWMAVAADMGATLVVTFNGLRMLRPATGLTADPGDVPRPGPASDVETDAATA